jgi:hypothetical protein
MTTTIHVKLTTKILDSTAPTSSPTIHSVHGDIRRTRALVSLGRNNLVVMVAHRHTMLSPSIEVVRSVDRAADTLLRADAPVLRESLGAVDRRRVYTRAGVDLVLAAVGGHGALVGQLAGRVVGAVGVEDVVFDERRARPAVDAQVGVAVGLEGAAVFDGSA